MLINFTVKNFKSFDDEVLLNLSAAKRFSLDNTIPVEAYHLNILPVTGIYGANGSGKSNLVNAVDFMRRKVTENLTPFPVPFKLDCQSKEAEQSSFSVLFIDSKNIMYHYGFSVCGSEVMEEWLSAYYGGMRESVLFERSRDDLGKSEFEYYFGQKFIKTTVSGKRNYLDFTVSGLKSTRLLVTELAERKGNAAAFDVYDWFRNHLLIIKPGAVYSAIPFAFMVDKKFTALVTELLRNMDFDFEGFETSSRHLDLNSIMAQVGGNAEFREKSLINANYFLDEDLVMMRNPQDEVVPALDDVFYDVNTGADDETELSQYMNIAYDEAIDKVQDATDKTTVLVEDISNKWKKSGRNQVKNVSDGDFNNSDDWWMSEEAFDEPVATLDNPFEKKN